MKLAAAELGITYTKLKSSLGEYVELGTKQNRLVAVHAGQMGPFSANGSAATASRWIAATQAQAVVSVGMAFGTLPSTQRPGDVLVSESLLPYDYRTIRCDANNGPVTDYSDIKSYKSHEPLVSLLRTQPTTNAHQVQFGPLLSGAARIHCAKFRDELSHSLLHHGLPIGGEMEGTGLLSLDTKWVIVKGVSDFADVHRDSIIVQTRPIACLNAARFVLQALN